MNPFSYGRIVSGEEFCPRPGLSKTLTGFIRSGQNVFVEGERRTGKTSLIHETARRMKIRMAYVDFLELRTARDVVSRLIGGLETLEREAGTIEKLLGAIAHLRPSITPDPVTGAPSLSIDRSMKVKPGTIESILDIFADKGSGKDLVVVLDEFQDILNLEDSAQVLAVMRGRIQFHENVSYIFAGSTRNEMNMIFTGPESPFFKAAASLEVGPIEHGAFTGFIRKKFEAGDRTVSDGTLERIYGIAQDIPGDIQQLCNSLWECSEPGDEIAPELLSPALELIFSREIKGYESALAELTGLQIRILASIARLGGEKLYGRDFLESVGAVHPNAVRQGLDRLEELKIVFRRQNAYLFVNPFFKAWLLHKGY